MFRIGSKVRLIHHDQYPQLVGLEGCVTDRREKTSTATSAAASRDATQTVYDVLAGPRTLHDVPEVWLHRR